MGIPYEFVVLEKLTPEQGSDSAESPPIWILFPLPGLSGVATWPGLVVPRRHPSLKRVTAAEPGFKTQWFMSPTNPFRDGSHQAPIKCTIALVYRCAFDPKSRTTEQILADSDDEQGDILQCGEGFGP